MGPPVMTMLSEGMPEGRIIHLGWDMAGGGGSGAGYFLAPGGDEDVMDIPLGQVRPFPAFDAMQMLSRVSKLPLSQMLAVKDDNKEPS